MNAEQWERIKTLFEAALNIPEERREGYLDSACGEDAELRRTVATLLRNHFSAAAFLQESSQETDPVFHAGDLVGERFRVTRFISRGGMGEVFEAYDERLKVRLALKTLRPEFLADWEALERFRREIRVAREVSHPNLCRVFDLIEHRDSERESMLPCLTMQLLEGESLAAYLHQATPLTASEALPLIKDIGAGLTALHEHGIVHRDLKPSNIMLLPAHDHPHRAIVMDFGLAKVFEGDRDLFESALDVGAGAPYYIAPELLKGEKPSAASDMYAFGLMVDEMVTSSRAFPQESVPSLLYQKMWGTPVLPSARGLRAPIHWEGVILRCLQPNPEARFANVNDLVATLENPPAESLDEPGADPLLNRLRGWRPSRRTMMALATSASLGVAAIAIPEFLSSKPASVLVFVIKNETNQSELDYLCHGTTAELMRRLSQVEGVQVVPYHDSRPERMPSDVKTRFVLDGMLQAFAGSIRLTIELTEARDRTLLWSRDFDRQLQNPLELQSDIAEGTVQAIEQRLLAGQSGKEVKAIMAATPLRRLFGFQSAVVSKQPTTSNVAFEMYLRGNQLYSDMNVASALAALDYFQKAVNEDPSFALAYAAMADAQIVLMDYNYAPFPELFPRALNFAERAVILGSDLAETHTTLAAIRQMSWNWTDADRNYREAIRLNPRYSRVYRYYGGMLAQSSRFGEALSLGRKALEMDPFDTPSQHGYGLILFLARRYRETITQMQFTLAQKEFVFSHALLGDTYAALAGLTSGGESAEWYRLAFEQARTAATIEQANTAKSGAPVRLLRFSDRMYALYYAFSGSREAAEPYLFKLTDDMAAGRASPAIVAMIYTALGEPDRALDLLEEAQQRKDRSLMYVAVHPFYEPLRRTDRFRSLLREMNLQAV